MAAQVFMTSLGSLAQARFNTQTNQPRQDTAPSVNTSVTHPNIGPRLGLSHRGRTLRGCGMKPVLVFK